MLPAVRLPLDAFRRPIGHCNLRGQTQGVDGMPYTSSTSSTDIRKTVSDSSPTDFRISHSERSCAKLHSKLTCT